MNQAELYTMVHLSCFCERFAICELRRLAKLCSNGEHEEQKRVQGVNNGRGKLAPKHKDVISKHDWGNQSTFEIIMPFERSTQKA